MSLSTCWNDARRMAATERSRRRAAARTWTAKRLFPIGRWSRFAILGLNATFAVASVATAPGSSDRFTGFTAYAVGALFVLMACPGGDKLLATTDFERLHAPAGGLMSYRVARLVPDGLFVGACWGVVASEYFGASPWFVATAVAMPLALVITWLLPEVWGSVSRIAIAVAFVAALLRDDGLLLATTALLAMAIGVLAIRGLLELTRHGFRAPGHADATSSARLEAAVSARVRERRPDRPRTLLGNVAFLHRLRWDAWCGIVRCAPAITMVGALVTTSFWILPHVFAVLAVVRSADEVALIWPVLAAILAPSLWTIDETESVYLWGVDLRRLERHNLVARLLSIGIPACSVATLTALIAGGGEVRWSAVLFVAACQIARLGLEGFHGDAFRVVAYSIAMLGMLVAGIVSGVSVPVASVLAVVVAAVGIVGIVVRLARSELSLRVRECF